jgi:hypothetical protein
VYSPELCRVINTERRQFGGVFCSYRKEASMSTVRGGGLILAASEWPFAGIFSRLHVSSLADRILLPYRTGASFIPAT